MNITTPFIYIGVVVALALATIGATAFMAWAVRLFARKVLLAYDTALLVRVAGRLHRRGLLKHRYDQ